jgi:hypothetical protein
MSFIERIEDAAANADEQQWSRKRFLGRLARGTALLAAGAAGLARVPKATAGNYACCDLCFASGHWCPSPYYGEFDCPCQSDEKWQWFCTDSLGYVWGCGECWPGYCADDSCYCSYAWNTRGPMRPATA